MATKQTKNINKDSLRAQSHSNTFFQGLKNQVKHEDREIRRFIYKDSSEKEFILMLKRIYRIQKRRDIGELQAEFLLKYTDKGMNDLGKILQNSLSQNLQHLLLQFSAINSHLSLGMESLMVGVRKLVPSLKSIDIGFKAYDFLGNKNIKQINSALRTGSLKLETLKLEVDSGAPPGSDILAKVTKGLGGNLPNLKNIEFNIYRSNFPINSFYNNLLRYSTKLEKLNLLLYIRDSRDDYVLLDLSRIINNNLKNLKEIDIAFKYSRISEDILRTLGNAIANKGDQLKSIKMDISTSRLEETCLESLGEAIDRDYPQLKHFSFKLKNPEQFRANLARFINKSVPNLDSLKIDYHKSIKEGDYELEELTKAIRNGNSHPREVDIRMDGVTDDGLKLFTEALCDKWCNLESLKLNFNSSDGLGEQGLKHIAHNIALKMKKLKKLKLSLAGCKGWSQSLADKIEDILMKQLNGQIDLEVV